MIKNVEQCFLCLLSIWMFSLENYSVFLFFNWVVCFVDIECMRCLHTFDINPCWSYHIFLHSVSQFSQFSHSVVSDSLQPHKLQHARPPCPSPTPGVHSNSCPLSRWCHPAISSSVVPFFSCPQSLPASRVFSNVSTLRMRWPKYWSFSFSIIPSKEHPGLISFRMDWLDLLAVQGTLKSLFRLPPSFQPSVRWAQRRFWK